MHSLALAVMTVFSAGNASALTFDEALARHQRWEKHPFQLVVDPRKFYNTEPGYSYPEYHYSRKLSVIGADGAEKPAPLAMVDALIEAEIAVMGDADERCRAAGQFISDDRLNDTMISNGIVFVEGRTEYDRDPSASNAGVAAKNVALALPRLLGNLYGGAAYVVDRQMNGYETLRDADTMFKADPLAQPYKVALGEGTPGWQHVYKAGDEYVAKAYVLNDPAAMRSFIRLFYRKGAGCAAYRVGAD
ncbi:hypothetical protein EPO15_10730 [bacterium]|nr:MAG: hypothetical protein EPO15_10730 [bacterium]